MGGKLRRVVDRSVGVEPNQNQHLVRPLVVVGSPRQALYSKWHHCLVNRPKPSSLINKKADKQRLRNDLHPANRVMLSTTSPNFHAGQQVCKIIRQRQKRESFAGKMSR